MVYKFKKHRRTIRPPFNAENLFLLGTARMMFWRRSLRKKIVKHKRGLRSKRAQQHAVPLAKEKSILLDEVGFETRFHRRDGVFSDPHPTFAGIADEVGGRVKEKCVPLDKVGFETTFHRRDGVFSDQHPIFAGIAAEVRSTSKEMDVVGGVSKTKHISTTNCSISSVGTRVDSPASYTSTGANVGATSQNRTDGIAAEVHGTTSEEMDVAGGVSKTKHISTAHCSIPSVGTRVDSPASYKSTGAIVGATSQNPADGIVAEVHGSSVEMDVAGGVSKTNHISTTHCSIPSVGTREDSPASNGSTESSSGTHIRTSEDLALSEMENQLEMWRESQVHEQKNLSERQQKIIASDEVIREMQDELSCLQQRVFDQKKLSVRLKKIIDEQKEEHERMYQERVVLIEELQFKEKLNDLFCDYPKRKRQR